MGKAVKDICKEAYVTVNYQLPDSMFCNIENMEATDELIAKIKEKMQEIIDVNLKIEKRTMTRNEATQFYLKNPSSKGRMQLDYEANNEIVLYYCEDYFNYMYGNIANRTGATKVFDLVKYKDGFLIRFPKNADINVMPEYKESKKLAWAFQEYEDIHKELNVSTVYKLNNMIKAGKSADIIMLAESLHEKKIARIADDIAKNKNIKMVLIAGPSSSGKTTFAQRLGIQLRLNGMKPVTISVDNYFLEREETPKDKNGNYDFECIEAIDMELFNDHLIRLTNGETVEVPEFDFKVGTKRYKGKTMSLSDNEILVIEGIHCLNDRLTSKIPSNQKYKIYTSNLTVLNMDYYNRISTTDSRLVRRIVRDYQFRGYSAKDTIKAWNKVNEGEEKNIFPYQEEANSIFNTSLIYEISALKDIAIPLLEEIKPEDEEYAEARRILDMLKYFESIPKEEVPKNSLLKEFLGGGNFEY
jgi:uridine kinase